MGVPEMSSREKVAIVTGAGQGIGRAIALELARNGADVIVADINETQAKIVANQVCSSGRRGLAIPFDAAVRSQVDALVARTIAALGRLDIMVNNAGITGSVRPFLDTTEEEWDRLFAVNTKGVLFGIQAAAREMTRRGQGGRIVNISSVAGKEGRPLLAPYCASKAAVISITQAASKALAPHRITVNAVCPAMIQTSLTETVVDQTDLLKEPETSPVPVSWLSGPRGEPEDVAKTVAFLASADAAYITGQSINVDGGRVLH